MRQAKFDLHPLDFFFADLFFCRFAKKFTNFKFLYLVQMNQRNVVEYFKNILKVLLSIYAKMCSV